MLERNGTDHLVFIAAAFVIFIRPATETRTKKRVVRVMITGSIVNFGDFAHREECGDV